MFKATSVVLALVVLVTLQSVPSYAKRDRQGNILKTVKIKTVCPARKKDLGKVLSVVSAVDLTLRFTHTKIGLLEAQLKHLKKGNKMMMNSLARMDRKLTGITRMIRKGLNQDKAKSLTICEGKKATLACKGGEKIRIMQAIYGRLNRRTCSRRPIRTTKCRAPKSVALVRRACHGKTRCVLNASNSVFGDPCKGTAKYLAVKYMCGN